MMFVRSFALGLLLAGCAGSPAFAQQNTGLNTPLPLAPGTAKQPADAVLDTKGVPGGTDNASEASPISPERAGAGFKTGTVVTFVLAQAVDSGAFKNGDSIHGTLSSPLRTSAGTTIAAGAKVDGTVVSAAKAGSLMSGGVLSLQLTRVGNVPVVTDVVDFNGTEGHKDIADAAPGKGTEAIAQAGAVLTFHVMENGKAPGIVPGATLTNANGGVPTVGSPAGAGGTGTPNRGPGVNQVPVNGGAKPTTNGPGR